MKFIITFGIDSIYKKQYAILNAENEIDARIFAKKTWGIDWAGIYNADTWHNDFDYTLIGEYHVK